MIEQLSPADIRILRAAPLFRMMPEAVFSHLLAESAVEVVSARSTIFRQGSPAHHFYVLLDGWLKLTRSLANGSEAVIGLFTRGEALAEAVALTGQSYPAQGEAVTSLRYLRLPAEVVRDAIANQPQVALAMIASTAQHLHQLMCQIEQLKSRRAPERVAEFLLSLIEMREGATKLQLPFDKTLIAARLGMQPESLSRAFANLRKHGVEVQGSSVRIKDLTHLLALLEDAADAFSGEQGEAKNPRQQKH